MVTVPFIEAFISSVACKAWRRLKGSAHLELLQGNLMSDLYEHDNDSRPHWMESAEGEYRERAAAGRLGLAPKPLNHRFDLIRTEPTEGARWLTE